MSQRWNRVMKWLSMAAAGGTHFQAAYPITTTEGINGGCNRFVGNAVLSSVDFCYLLDCDSGFFGGLVKPCTDIGSGPFLLDCEGGGTTTDDTGTDTGTGTGTGTTTTG